MARAPQTTQDLFNLALKGQIPQEPQGFEGPKPLINFLLNTNSSGDGCPRSSNDIDSYNNYYNNNNNNLIIIDGNSNNSSNSRNKNNNDKTNNTRCSNDENKSINNCNKNAHLNPFYEISKMTESDIRNYRYNNGFEETSKW